MSAKPEAAYNARTEDRMKDRDTLADIVYNPHLPRHVRWVARQMLDADDKDRRDGTGAWSRG